LGRGGRGPKALVKQQVIKLGRRESVKKVEEYKTDGVRSDSTKRYGGEKNAGDGKELSEKKAKLEGRKASEKGKGKRKRGAAWQEPTYQKQGTGYRNNREELCRVAGEGREGTGIRIRNHFWRTREIILKKKLREMLKLLAAGEEGGRKKVTIEPPNNVEKNS